jgi:tRNA(Ile)-lysidine synthase
MSLPQQLRATLGRLVPQTATGLVVALSGGADSGCLLAALADAGQPRFRGLPVRAVHVDHGLQNAAAQFLTVCLSACRRLEVPLTVLEVCVDVSSGVSVEAAARDARYAALRVNLAAGECLLTAHHADDQAETLLLQLLRGTGLKGLSAMPPCRAWAGGWHVRPLLEVSRRELRAFGSAACVEALEDPMNVDPRFDRAYLRAALWPAIEGRWPGAVRALSRTARHVAEAQSLLERSIGPQVARLRDGPALSLAGLRSSSRAVRAGVLRHWIEERGAPPPPAARLEEALRQALTAGDDQLPAIVWGEHALRRYRDRLFVTAARSPRLAVEHAWALDRTVLPLGDGLGFLEWSERRGGLDAARLPGPLIVRGRRGGERIRPSRHAGTRSLKHLCQARGVLPWMRDALPLVFAGEHLIAVADLWRDVRWCAAPGATGLVCRWREAPVCI